MRPAAPHNTNGLAIVSVVSVGYIVLARRTVIVIALVTDPNAVANPQIPPVGNH